MHHLSQEPPPAKKKPRKEEEPTVNAPSPKPPPAKEVKEIAVVRRADGGQTELRGNINTESFNGVFVDSGEQVTILAEAEATDGTIFINIAYGKKKGWIRADHVHQGA